MTSRSWVDRLQHAAMAVAAAVALLLAPIGAPAGAQTTTGSVRGFVTTKAGEAAAGATVTARNVETGLQRSSLVSERGAYALLGLVAGDYEITSRRVGLQPVTKRQRVAIGQTLSLDFMLDDASAHGGLAPGEADRVEPEPLHAHAGDALDLLEGEQVLAGLPDHALGRHAVTASKIAPVGQRYAQVTGNSPIPIH